MIVYQLKSDAYIIRPLIEDDTVINHYGLENVPVKYIEAEPDFGTFENELTELLFDKFPNKQLCLRGISMYEHNLLNKTPMSHMELAEIISRYGSDRYDSDIAGDRYDNVDDKRIDFFALDFDTSGGENNFWYMFNTFYYYGVYKYGHPRMVDILTVYDTAELNRVEYRYDGDDEIRSDAFCIPDNADMAKVVLGIIVINS
jgi:hypothetical protein